MDLVDTTSTDLSTLERLLALPLTKFLGLVMYQLLTSYSWAGGNDLVFGTHERQARKEPNRLDTLAPNLKRTRVHESERWATTRKVPVSTSKEKETVSDDGDIWLHVNSNGNL